MPNRIIRDWTDSDPVNTLSSQEEKHFIRLIMKADDYGRLFASTRQLRPHLYPFQLDQVRETDVERWTAACAKAGLIRLYSVDGKQYLEIVNFGQRVRADKSKYPAPPPVAPGPPPTYQLPDKRPSDDSHPRTETEAIVEVGDVPPKSPKGDGFEAFWNAYPRKVGKDKAQEAWKARVVRKNVPQAEVLSALAVQKRSKDWEKDNGQFIPHPTTWLNQGRWKDEPVAVSLRQPQADRGAMIQIRRRSFLCECHGWRMKEMDFGDGDVRWLCTETGVEQEWARGKTARSG